MQILTFAVINAAS